MTVFPRAADLTVDQIQTELQMATEKLDVLISQTKDTNEVAFLRIQTIRNAVRLVLLLSDSANGIPGLRGIGLENTLLLAQRINSQEKLTVKDFDIKFRILTDSISL